MRLYLLFTLLFTSCMFGQLSDKHWLPPLHSRTTSHIGQHVVYLSTPEATPFQVNVTNGNGVAVGTYTISAGLPAQFTVGNSQPSNMFVTQAGLHTVSGNSGLILSGTSEFYVTFKLDAGAHGEMFVSKGRAGLGTDFRLGSSPQGSSDSSRNFVASVMATENGTTVTVSDYDAGVYFTTPTGTNANGTQTFTLSAGQSVVLSGYADNATSQNLTGFIGARLTSTRPVAVNTGNITNNPATGGNDVCLDQIVPVERVGMEYIVVKGNGTAQTELPIVIATQNNTQVFVNGNTIPLTTLNAGDYYIVPFTYFQGTFNQNMYVETDKPVYLYQILAGDTSTHTTGMNFIPPLSCSYPKVVDLIPSINLIGSGVNFNSGGGSTNVILITVAGSVISINGAVTTATPQPVLGNPNWVTYRISGLSGNVKVESTGSTAVGVLGLSGTMGVASFYSGFGEVNLTYEAGVNIYEGDMTIAEGRAICPDNTRVLDTNLSPNDFTFVWTVDIGDGNGPQVIAGATGPAYTVDSPGTYCVTTSNGFIGSACEQTDCVVVEYYPDFVINDMPNDLYSCDNTFDLSQNTATILNGLDPFQYDLEFFATLADALDPDATPIANIQTTNATVTTFYVLVTDINSNCVKITEFDAVVSSCQINQPPNMVVCDDITNNGTETFDLTTQDAAILGALSAADFTITYHLTQAGADAGNALATPVTAYVGGPNQVIYVRMESNLDPTQYSTTTFNLIVNPLPTASIGTSTICEGTTGTVTITGTPNATVQYLDNVGATQTVVLDGSGQAVVTTPVLNADATYSLVDVTSVENCTRTVNGTATVTVLPLPTASISANTICQGTTGTVTITGTPNATVHYTVDGGANQTVVLDAAGYAIITSPILNLDSVYCLVDVTSNTTPACTQAVTSCATITIIPLPTATITANTTCSGSTGEVTISGTPNATVNYTVDGGTTQTVVLDAAGDAIITSPILSADSVYCLVDVTSNTTPACTQAVTSCATITVLPLPTASIVANTTCEGSTGEVTITGTPNATVQYTVDGGATQTVVLDASGQAIITSPILLADSVYCLVDVTSNTSPACTQSVTSCATIVVNPLPTVSISTTTPSICDDGSVATIDFTGTPGATITYTVDGGANQTIVLDAAGNASVTTSVTSTYCLVSAASNSTPVCTQAFTNCITINVNQLPTASIVGSTVCTGDTATVTFTGTPDATVNYTIDGVMQTPVTLSPTGSAVIASTPSIGVYAYCLVDVTSNTTPACTETLTQCVNVEALPAPVANPITEIHVCDDNVDGFATFDLTNAVNEAQGGDPSLTVTIHETDADANFSSNALIAAEILAYQNIDPYSQVLHIRVENAGGCYIVIPFTIVVDPRPALNQNVADYELCDVNNSPDGIEQFDLTNAALTADITNGEPGLTLYYYDNQPDALANNTANQIPNPATYSNTSSPNQQTIWVTAQNAAGCIHTTSFDLIVNPLPVVVPLNDMNGCSDGVNPTQAPFNLTFNNSIVTAGQSGFIVSYHLNQTDADNDANAITATPYIGTDGQIIIVRVENATTGCYTTTTVQLNVTQGPAANTPTPLTYCDPNNDGIGIFDLEDALNDISGGPTPTGVTVTFHETPQDAQLGTNAIDTTVLYNNIVPNQQTIYISVSYASTGCTNFTELELIVNPTPEIVSPANPLQECDDDTDQITQFDLTQVEAEVLNGIDPTTVTISYYLSQAAADAGTPNISNVTNFTNSSNPQTIYIRVQYTATGCYSVESFELVVNALPNMPAPEDITMSVCDENNPGDQIECFDLNSQIPLIVDGQTNMIVTFHFSQADAIAGVSPLPSPYCNTSNAQSIFVRLENGATGCFDTVIMDLRVEPLPVLVAPDPVEECGANQDGFAIFDLNALETDMLNGASGITLTYYETLLDAQNQVNAIPVANQGAYQNIDPFNQVIYVLAVNDVTGCSSITMIQLIAHPAPIMPTLDDLIVCDTNQDGLAYFDLTQQNSIILAANTLSPLQIRYYTTAINAANGTAAIVDPANFYGGPNQQTIWVVVTNPATGCSATTTFDLIINLPVNVSGQNNRLTLCDEDLPNDQFTTFDLTVMNAQILVNGTPGATVTYYLNLADAQSGNNPIATPTAFVNTIAAVQTLYAVVTTTDGCNSITTLTIRVEPLPTPKMNPPAIIVCDDDQTMIGTEQFDLTTNITYIEDGYPNLTFEYYPTEADAHAGTNEILNPTTYEGSGTIIIKVMNNRIDFFGENCYRLVEQELIVNPLPVIVDTTYVICDDDTDGVATFDLSFYNEQLLDTTNTGQATADFTVTYYDTQANAQAGTATGLLPNTYTGADQDTIYPRVVNNATGCVNVLAEVTLEVKLRAIANPISQTTLDLFTVCDYYGANDGVEQFDLTIVETELLGSQTMPPISITYHLNAMDQASGANAIVDPTTYENTTSPGTQIIYVRVQRANDDGSLGNECYDVAEITLNVELLAEPVITSPSETICVDFNTGDLLSGLVLDSGIPAGSGYTYQWALNGVDITDGTGVDATYVVGTVAPGEYTVVVTSAQGCVSNSSDPFTVIQSGPPANIETYISGAFDETQTITVIHDGYGEYEYQLEPGGPWQSSPVFTNVPAGVVYNIQIRDVKTLNPCDGDETDAVEIINYPHFFTPNGDGINDKWNIVGLNQSDAVIYIFDRYGKLLKQISATGDGWNGTLNGQLLPATDYWFTVDYKEIKPDGTLVPKQFKAHFSLKR